MSLGRGESQSLIPAKSWLYTEAISQADILASMLARWRTTPLVIYLVNMVKKTFLPIITQRFIEILNSLRLNPFGASDEVLRQCCHILVVFSPMDPGDHLACINLQGIVIKIFCKFLYADDTLIISLRHALFSYFSGFLIPPGPHGYISIMLPRGYYPRYAERYQILCQELDRFSGVLPRSLE